MSLFLKNATFIDWKTLDFKTTNIQVEEDDKKELKFHEKLPQDAKQDEIIDCNGKFVTKSFACGHHHVYSALSRGMGAPKKSPENFHEILRYIWWTLDKALDKEMIEASALVTAIACAKSGVSFAIDHHASPNSISGSLQTIADAFDKVGVSHLLCYEISDRDGNDRAVEGLSETDSYLKDHQGLVGLHASFTVGEESMRKAADLAMKYNSGIHIHVAEDLYDQSHCQTEYGKRVVERLNDYGVLDFSKTILGHCIHLNDNEKALIEKSKAWIVQNSESNLNNNVGYFNSDGLGNNVMLGTDGMHSDMLRSAKAAFYVGQGFDNIDFPKAYARFRKAHEYLALNNFSGDGCNNLVIMDYDSPTPFSQQNFLGHFIFGLESKHVTHLISDGKLILNNGKIENINESEAFTFAREQADRLWKRMQNT